MTSISIRSHNVPQNLILFRFDNKLPPGQTHDGTFLDRYIRGTPTAGTNPGGTEGAATHIHGSSGGHTHTGGANGHTHTGVTNATTQHVNIATLPSQTRTSTAQHTHTWTSDSTSAPLTTDSSGGHTHNADTNLPQANEEYFTKATGSISIRNRTIPVGSIFMWGQASGLPSRYTIDSTLDDRFLKCVPTLSSGADAQVGLATHTHDAHPTHTHVATLPIHSHTSSGNTSTHSGALDNANGAIIAQTHNHATNSLAHDNNAATIDKTTSADPQSTNHPAQNFEPAYKAIQFVKTSVVGLRLSGFPIGALAFWLDTVATIPFGWQVADGNNGTSNYLNTYIRGTSGAPGGTGGSNTHTHATGGGTHAHTVSGHGHVHPQSGNTGGPSATLSVSPTDDTEVASQSHSHQASGNSGNTDPSSPLLDDTDIHTHNSQNNQPKTVLVSILEKI